MAEQLATVYQFPIGGNRTQPADEMAQRVSSADLLTDLKPGRDGLIHLGCMDDRDPDEADSVLYGDPYLQDAGGQFGVSQDLATAMEMQKRGFFVDDGRDIDVLASVVSMLLMKSGVLAVNHEKCAAYLGARPVAQSARDTRPEVYQRALGFNSGLNFLQYDRAAAATGRILDFDRIAPPEVSAERMKSDSIEHPSINFARLRDKDHAAVAFMAIQRMNKVIDTAKANRLGLALYGVNVGNLPELHKIIYPYIPVDLENFTAAHAARHAAIGYDHLMDPATQRPLPILTDVLPVAA